MPAISASAPGKIILFGEHAVVYNQPAMAVPVMEVQARAAAFADIHGKQGEIFIEAPDIQLNARLEDLPKHHPLAVAIYAVFEYLKVNRIPAFKLKITSTIPSASGLGSGAAVTVAVIRAVSKFIGQPLGDEQVNQITFEVEKLYHGTPSGIDNTVITYAMPIFFIKDRPVEVISIPVPFTMVIGDTGIRSPTADLVSLVRMGWETDRDTTEKIFDKIGEITHQARQYIESGNVSLLGTLMNENQTYLQKLNVSSKELDGLVEAAILSGALGAKLSGGGGGGNMIALTDRKKALDVSTALRRAGAVHTIVTEVRSRS